jgi:VCBS repeat-containing protein
VITYTYTLNDNTTSHSSVTGEDSVFENLAVVLTDVDGDTANATLSAKIVDDVPTANPDTDNLNNVTQTASGNVISGLGTTSSGADVPGADGASGHEARRLDVRPTSTTAMISWPSAPYGTLSMSANGEYNYTRSGNAPLNDTDTFTYTLEDADGDKSTATLTISITDKGSRSPISRRTPGGGDVIVDEDDLSDGSDTSKESTTGPAPSRSMPRTGWMRSPSAGTKVIDNGALTANLTITTPLGNTLTVTGYDSGTGVISYSYTLNDNTTTHSAATGEDSVFENLAVVLTDVDGDTANGTLSAKIVDDVPTANPDTDNLNNVTQTASGNVISGVGTTSSGADVPGADGATVTKLVGFATTDIGQQQRSLGHRQVRHSAMSANGEYTYTRSGNTPLTDTDSFTYTLEDADGDKSTATLTISIKDQDVTITNLTPSGGGGDVTVDEDDLSASRGIGESAGSDTTPESTTASGDFKISAPDGVDEVSIAGTKVIDNGASHRQPHRHHAARQHADGHRL